MKMSLTPHATNCCHETPTMSLMSPFSVLSRLQHSSGMRCCLTVDHCRRHRLNRSAHIGRNRVRRRAGDRAFDTAQCPRHASTTCRAQAVVADPAVTGKSQNEASPVAGTKPSPPKSAAYPFEELEAKWQDYWLKHKTFRTPGIKELDKSKPKFYALDMFPYPRSVGPTCSLRLNQCLDQRLTLLSPAAALDCMLVIQKAILPQTSWPATNA